jgi:transposase
MGAVPMVGVDLAQSVFQVYASNSDGRAVTRKRLPRTRFLSFMSQIKPCVVAMEACATSHHWARELIALGHEVRLTPQSM